MNIISNHGNPNDYGFNVDENVITNIHDFLIKNTVNTGFWIPIQNAFKEERTFWQQRKELSWILTLHLNSLRVYCYKAIQKIKVIIKK